MMEGWKYINLGDVIHIKHGYGFKGKYFVEEPNHNLLLTPGNFAIGGGFKSDKMKYYDGPINDEFVLFAGDVIVTMTDLSMKADTLGYSAKIPNNPENTYLHNQRLGLVSLKTNEFDLDYIYWLLRTYNYQKYIAGSSSGATVKHTSPKKIYSAKLLVPESKVTQKRIADILSAYDDLIKNNQKRIKLLEQAAQNIYKEWFVNLRFPGHENTPVNEETGLPVGWKNVLLSELYDTSSGGTPSRGNSNFYNGDIKWFKTKELKDCLVIDSGEHISINALKKSSAKMFPKNTVVMAMYGTTIGRLAILTEGGSTNQACCAILTKGEVFNHHYSFHWLKLNREQILGLRMGAAQENISQTVVKQLNILKPKDNIVLEFNKIQEDNFNLTLNLTKQLLRLKAARDILLPRLMNRTIEV